VFIGEGNHFFYEASVMRFGRVDRQENCIEVKQLDAFRMISGSAVVVTPIKRTSPPLLQQTPLSRRLC
jgi:hypothetical protein